MLDEIVYLGTTVSAAAISPPKEKAQSIRDGEPPANVPELQSFLGSANILCKFVPDFARLVAHLYKLLRKETPWKWEKP